MGQIVIKEVSWDDPDAVTLRAAMSQEMDERYRDRMSGYGEQRAAVLEALSVSDDTVVYVAVAYTPDGDPVGHAALRRHGADIELKRMYVTPGQRGRGVSQALLVAAEDAARALGADRLVLQTGDRQPDAITLYERAGYARIPVFPPYEVLDQSICMARDLR